MSTQVNPIIGFEILRGEFNTIYIVLNSYKNHKPLKILDLFKYIIDFSLNK
jgi:hypothetical protein